MFSLDLWKHWRGSAQSENYIFTKNKTEYDFLNLPAIHVLQKYYSSNVYIFSDTRVFDTYFIFQRHPMFISQKFIEISFLAGNFHGCSKQNRQQGWKLSGAEAPGFRLGPQGFQSLGPGGPLNFSENCALYI